MMSERKRKFFSGRSVGQAVVAAASYYGVDPDDLAYREIEKRHGFVRTRRKAVIAVDPESLLKQESAEPSPAPEPVAGSSGRRAPEAQAHEPASGSDRGRRERGGPEAERPAQRAERAGRSRSEAAESSREEPTAEDPEGAPAPEWWHGERVEPAEREPEQAAPGVTEHEPGRRVDRSEGLTRRGDESEESAPRRPRRERARRPAAEGGGATARDEEGGRRRRPRRREEPPARQEPEPPPPPPPLERPAPRADRLERLEAGELEDSVLDALDIVLDFVDVEAEADLFVDGERLEIELYGPDDHILLEDDGQLLLAIEHLLPRMIRGLYGDAMPVRVDCADFHFEREERLREVARRTADEARRQGKSRTLADLDPAERRIVHLALADDPTVETESVGGGYHKRLRVIPK